jgi:hypothetical protein
MLEYPSLLDLSTKLVDSKWVATFPVLIKKRLEDELGKDGVDSSVSRAQTRRYKRRESVHTKPRNPEASPQELRLPKQEGRHAAAFFAVPKCDLA